jgi:DNA-binding transcriptional MerR regulator
MAGTRMTQQDDRLMRVGELARAVGKTVRAMHLYEELGLLEPASRSDGGFRLYGHDAIERINWIVKLQAIGFTLSDIQGFVRDFAEAHSGRDAAQRVRLIFAERLAHTREQITHLQVIENDLLEAIHYLDSCTSCSTKFAPTECGACGHQGHVQGDAPQLFAGLSRRGDTGGDRREFDVPVTGLYREGPTGSEGNEN